MMETQQPQPRPAEKRIRDAVEKKPIGMAMAYFKLTEQDQILGGTSEINECTRQFIEYLAKFQRTSDAGQCQEISRFLSNIKQENKGVSEKDLLQIWNLGLRSLEEIQTLFPGVVKALTDSTLQSIITLLETKTK